MRPRQRRWQQDPLARTGHSPEEVCTASATLTHNNEAHPVLSIFSSPGFLHPASNLILSFLLLLLLLLPLSSSSSFGSQLPWIWIAQAAPSSLFVPFHSFLELPVGAGLEQVQESCGNAWRGWNPERFSISCSSPTVCSWKFQSVISTQSYKLAFAGNAKILLYLLHPVDDSSFSFPPPLVASECIVCKLNMDLPSAVCT